MEFLYFLGAFICVMAAYFLYVPSDIRFYANQFILAILVKITILMIVMSGFVFFIVKGFGFL